MGIVKDRKRQGAVCPRCKHPDYTQRQGFDRPLFTCTACAMAGRLGILAEFTNYYVTTKLMRKIVLNIAVMLLLVVCFGIAANLIEAFVPEDQQVIIGIVAAFMFGIWFDHKLLCNPESDGM